MKTASLEIGNHLSERDKVILEQVCNAKGLTPERAVSLMVHWACLLLEEIPLQKRSELLNDLDTARAEREKTMHRVDQLLGVAELVLLETQSIKSGLAVRSNRTTA